MLATFLARLEACDPEHNHMRSYRLEAGRDLLGAWTVDVTYGRIGSKGRTIRHVVEDEEAARKLARECLRRRASAPKRFGVAYELRERVGPDEWEGPPLIPGMPVAPRL